MRLTTLLLCFGAVLAIHCSDNGFNIPSIPGSGEIPGEWTFLEDDDTLEVYIRLNNEFWYLDTSVAGNKLATTDTTYFQVWTESLYARDSSFVYFPIDTTCVRTDSSFVCFLREYVIEGANPLTFRYLGNGYATDGNELYLNGKIYQGNDGEDF